MYVSLIKEVPLNFKTHPVPESEYVLRIRTVFALVEVSEFSR